MTKSTYRFVVLILIIVLCQGVRVSAQPNVLLIIADDLGVDYANGYQDNPIKPNTPNLDAMKANGLTFENAWSAPVCTPTRAAIMSGKYGSKSGVLGLADNFDTTNISIFSR